MKELKNRLADTIGGVQVVRKISNKHRSWMFNEEGIMHDNVVCCDILPYLEELKQHEIHVNNDTLESIIVNSTRSGYTYNQNANVTNDLEWRMVESKDGSYIVAMRVHLLGDARTNFTGWFVCKFDYENQMFEMENVSQTKEVSEKYMASLNMFSETYEVYDSVSDETVGYFYEVEAETLLEEIADKLKEQA